MSGSTIDWSNYEQQVPSAPQIDFAKYEAPNNDDSIWGKIKSALAPRKVEGAGLPGSLHEFGERLRAPNGNPGSSEGAGLLEGLSDYDEASGGEIAGGVHDVSKGNVARGLHRVISGFMAAATPVASLVLPSAAMSSPITTGLGLAGGIAGQKLGRGGAEALGATPDQADLASDVGGLAGGYAASKVPDLAKKAVLVANHPVVQALWKTADVATFNRLIKLWDAWKNVPEEIRARGPQFTQDPGAPLPATPAPEQLNPSLVSPARTLPGQIAPEQIAPLPRQTAQPIPPRSGLQLPAPRDAGAPLPETPTKELVQAQPLAQGGRPPVPEPAAALGNIPVRNQDITPQALQQALQEKGAQAPLEDVLSRARDLSSSGPRTFSGESALRQVLTGQDNANLLKIAKSRGINVSQEAQLKPGVADNRLVNKIIGDMSPEELDEVAAQYLENHRFQHTFGDIGKEAWKTMSLQTYFPDVKIPAATLKRTNIAIQGAKPAVPASGDLTDILQESLRRAQAAKAASSAGND